MSVESYHSIFKNENKGEVLRQGRGKKSFKFSFSKKNDEKYRLFAVGETGLFYQWKNEPDNHMQYRTISDALDRENAERSAYALSLSSKRPEGYIRRAYKKILWTPKLAYINMNPTPDNWTIGFRAKAKELITEADGYIRLRLDVRYIKPGVSRESNELSADETHIITITDGTYDYRDFSKELTLPSGKIASVSVFFEGVRYSGEVYIEEPYLVSHDAPDKSVLPDFGIPATARDYYDWSAQYLSRKEWPEFRLTLNGSVFFEGEIFERCHRGSEWALNIPQELIEDENTLDIELISSYREPLPYTLTELAIIASPEGKFSPLAVSIGALGKKAYALIRTGIDNLTLKASYPDELSGDAEFYFPKKGLHGISVICNKAGENFTFSLSDGENEKPLTIPRVAIKEYDGVLAGTGDMIYVRQDLDDIEEFLTWYISEGLGNLLTIRPVYRWSGTRTLNPNAISELVRILNELGIKYSHMIDGRELPGLNANPDEKMLEGDGFLGRQMHERDGAIFYWRRYKAPSSTSELQIKDLEMETFREDAEHSNPDIAPVIYIYPELDGDKSLDTIPTFDGDDTGADTCYLHRNPSLPHDMEKAHSECVLQIAKERFGAPRHTGPSTMFKYLYEGGYEWLGAETMYGTMESLMAFLRGASLAKGNDRMGTHHALQWSSSPHDVPEHVWRYRLALYVSYMQGATEINTEEGLWHLEEYYSRFSRFSDACINHKKAQKDFIRYIMTHTRRGKFYTPMGILHGRYDGWHAFGRNSAWGWKNVIDSDAEKSWDSLSVFYPEGNLGDTLYFHGFPADKPLGFHSSTPICNIDAIPVEADGSCFENYKALAFLGYNKAEPDDCDKLLQYVKHGGTLLVSLAHMTSTTSYDKICRGELEFSENSLMPSVGTPIFEVKTYSGKAIPVLINPEEGGEVLTRCDDGTALVVRYKLGEGYITYFMTSAYPAHPAIKELYERELESAAQKAISTLPFQIKCASGVEHAIYKREDCYDIYLLAVDWYRGEEKIRHAKISQNGTTADVLLPFGVMVKAVSDGKHLAYPHTENGEVISVEGGLAYVQGTGRVKFTLMSQTALRDIELDFTKDSVQKIKI